MKIVLLCSPEANQRALAHRLTAQVPIATIVACGPKAMPENSAQAKIRRLARGIAGLPLRYAWFGMLTHFDEMFPQFPQQPILTVDDVNNPQVRKLVDALRPDLVIVSGTNLLKQPLIDAIANSGKVMNLHTGISPYLRGGPNCTNWCLATGQFHLIGNTVMWIDAGIDTGNLIATERTPLDGSETLQALHTTVIDHAHDLLVRCVKLFVAGANLPNVPQRELGIGQLFLSRHWNAVAAARAAINFMLRYRREIVTGPATPLALVSPERVSGVH